MRIIPVATDALAVSEKLGDFMKNRILFGVMFGLLGVLVVIFPFWPSPLPDIIVFTSTLIAIFELNKTFGVKNKAVFAFSIVFSALVMFYHGYASILNIDIPVFPVLVIYIIMMLSIIVIDFGKTRFEHIGLSIIASIVLPSAVASYMKLRNLYFEYDGLFTKGHIRFLVWFVLGSAVWADTFALFTGIKFGKHKLCPRVSPKKTVEGAIGGIIGAAASNIIALIICNSVCERDFPIPVWFMVILSFITPAVSMLGDLIASTIKRNYGVKDFGNLIPGHGGMMDRLDSIGISMPFVYAVLCFAFKIFSIG